MIEFIKIKEILKNWIIFLLTVLLPISGHTQNYHSQSYGNLFVKSGTEYKIYTQHSFKTGNYGLKKGVIGTSRENPPGLVGFLSSYQKDDTAFVDGYVKSHVIGPFIFPVGDNNIYKPVYLGDSESAIVGYFFSDPSIAITDFYDGTVNTSSLPSGAPFIPQDGTSVKSSTIEYWDIQSSLPQKISLPWDISSDIFSFINILEELTILGWKNNQWEVIPSEIDETNVFNSSKKSKEDSGSITTTVDITPNEYEVYTLGKLKSIDLEIKYTTDKTESYPGDLLIFSISVANKGDTEGTNIKITAPITEPLTFVESNKPDQYDSTSGVWSIPNIDIGKSDTLKISVRVNEDIEGEIEVVNTISEITHDQLDSEFSEDILENSFPIIFPGLGIVFDVMTPDGRWYQ